MNLDPFYSAPLGVQIHVIAAIQALLLGPFVLYRNKRDVWHKALGYLWVTNVLIAAFSSFWITEIRVIGPFSPIHGLSLWALWALWGIGVGVGHVRAGRITAHKMTMTSLYWGAIGVASLLTLLPGRRLNRTLFGENEVLGLWVIAAIIVLVVAFRFSSRRRQTTA